MAAEDDVFTLLEVNDVFVFKIPAASSASGHRAKDWTNQVWDGTLKVLQKGDKAVIQLVGRDGKLFAMAPVTVDGPPAYEPVSDSSRYFVLRISDGKGRHTFIGLGFQERAEAFDFKTTLVEFEEEAKLAKSGKSRLNVDDKKIETLEEGQTIKLNLAAGAGSGGRTKRSTRLGGGLKKPSGLRKPTTQAAPSTSGGEEDLLGGLSSSMAATSISGAPAAAPTPAPAPAPADDWEPF